MAVERDSDQPCPHIPNACRDVGWWIHCGECGAIYGPKQSPKDMQRWELPLREGLRKIRSERYVFRGKPLTEEAKKKRIESGRKGGLKTQASRTFKQRSVASKKAAATRRRQSG